MVKNPPAMQETQVPYLGREDPLEKGMATHSSVLPGESHRQRSLAGCSPWGRKESDTTEWVTHITEQQMVAGELKCSFQSPLAKIAIFSLLTESHSMTWVLIFLDPNAGNKEWCLHCVHSARISESWRWVRKYKIVLDRGRHIYIWFHVCVESIKAQLGFCGGSVVKNPPASEGDMGSIPDLGRSLLPQSNEACMPQLLSLSSCSRAWEMQLQKPKGPKARALQQEKPWPWAPHAPQLDSSRHSPQLEVLCGDRAPAQPKINKIKYI